MWSKLCGGGGGCDGGGRGVCRGGGRCGLGCVEVVVVVMEVDVVFAEVVEDVV